MELDDNDEFNPNTYYPIPAQCAEISSLAPDAVASALGIWAVKWHEA